VQVQLILGQPVQSRLGTRQAVDGIQSGLFDAVRRIRLFDNGTEDGNGPLYAIDCFHDYARAPNMPASLVTNLDVDLVPETQRFDCRVE